MVIQTELTILRNALKLLAFSDRLRDDQRRAANEALTQTLPAAQAAIRNAPPHTTWLVDTPDGTQKEYGIESLDWILEREADLSLVTVFKK